MDMGLDPPIQIKSKQSIVMKEPSCIERFWRNNLDDIRSGDFWRAAFAEYVGTFLLVFAGVASGLKNEGSDPVPIVQIALGVGFMLGILITTLSTVSLGHINPSISFSFLLSNEITFIRFVVYVIFQTLGSITALALMEVVQPDYRHGSLGLLQPAPEVTDGMAIGMEMIVTGIMVFVTHAMTDPHRTDVSGSVPYLIGLSVTVGIIIAGNVSGGCMNPARAMGPAVILRNMTKQWIYWVGPFSGSALAVLLYTRILSTRPIGIIKSCIKPRKQSHQYDLPDEVTTDPS